MAIVSGVITEVSKRDQEKRVRAGQIGRIFGSIGKYAVDLAVNFSSKSDSGRRRKLHKAVQEEIKELRYLKSCNSSENTVAISTKEKVQTKMDKVHEETSTPKHKSGLSPEKMEPMSLNKLPPEQLKEKDVLLPNKKRIMIRSRL